MRTSHSKWTETFADLVSLRVSKTLRKKSARKFSAFTLVELIVVITILAILATIGFLALSGYSQDAKDSAIKANVRSVQTAISSESALTNNSPRYYVVHDTGASLSGAFAYVDGNQTALTGWDWNVSGTNYSAGNPDYAKLKMNPEKFKVSSSGLPGGTLGIFARAAGFGSAEAAYDARYLTVGAMDAVPSSSAGGKKRSVSYFQVAGISPATGAVTVSGNYPASSGSVSGLVKDPKSTSSTGALSDGAISGMGPPPVPGTCGAANRAYVFSAPSFGPDAFCPSWAVPSPASPAFPAAGNSVSWTCPGQNGGAPASCTASHGSCAANPSFANLWTLTVWDPSASATAWSYSATPGNCTYACAPWYSGTSCLVLSIMGDDASGRKWLDGSYAKSCKEYRNPPASRSYAWSTGDGVYWIDPDGAWSIAGFKAFCDMTTDDGGWTLVMTATNAATIPAWTTGDFNSSVLPSKGLGAKYSDAVINAVYSSQFRATSTHSSFSSYKLYGAMLSGKTYVHTSDWFMTEHMKTSPVYDASANYVNPQGLWSVNTTDYFVFNHWGDNDVWFNYAGITRYHESPCCVTSPAVFLWAK